MKTNLKTALVLVGMTLAASLAQAKNVDIKIFQCRPLSAVNAETGELNSRLSPHDALKEACADKTWFKSGRITSVRFDSNSNRKLVLTASSPDTTLQIDSFVNDITVVFASQADAKREKDLLESGRVAVVAFDPRNMNFNTTDEQGRKISIMALLESGFPTLMSRQLIQSLNK